MFKKATTLTFLKLIRTAIRKGFIAESDEKTLRNNAFKYSKYYTLTYKGVSTKIAIFFWEQKVWKVLKNIRANTKAMQVLRGLYPAADGNVADETCWKYLGKAFEQLCDAVMKNDGIIVEEVIK